MNVAEFIAKWKKAELTEKSASQQHFLDLCELFDHPKPAAVDPTGEEFTFEKGATKHGGGDGWADVWKRGFFGWEYKGKKKDLDKAYDQLLKYREALENPPLLVVCDMNRFIIRTNFTATATQTYDFTLEELDQPQNVEVLRSVFHTPNKLKPGTTSEAITKEAAESIAQIAQSLRDRGHDPRQVAHFLDRIVFSLFAEDIDLLPDMLLTRLLEKCRNNPPRFSRVIGDLFEAMATGGDFGADTIRHFNGNLFDQQSPILDLTQDDIEALFKAAKLDWSAVDPSIFGTLFERGLDPAKRAQLGAHYTSREDIETLVEPVVMQPLRREWLQARQLIDNLLTTGRKKPPSNGESTVPTGPRLKKAQRESNIILRRFLHRLAQVTVLDPACGSGNFLYVTLQKLKDLEKEAIVFGMEHGLAAQIPLVGPWQLFGIEINAYAHELAQMTVWVGYLQWIKANGFGVTDSPVLRAMDNFQNRDAILDLSDPENPKEPEWPKVEFIVGNPPFLGSRIMRAELGDPYCLTLFRMYQERLGGRPDLVCYWFDRARKEIESGRCQRAGLLATQGIRGGTNRRVLKQIKESGNIFFAESDRPWILDGANVHVSMVGFDAGKEIERTLDGNRVSEIHANLTSGADLTKARALSANQQVAFQGGVKRGPFEMPASTAIPILVSLGNPNQKANSDVLLPYFNAVDITRRPQENWLVHFGDKSRQAAASQYADPFEHVRQHVRPARKNVNQIEARENWWLHWRTRPKMVSSLKKLTRFLVTPRVARHRVFQWLSAPAYPDNALVVFARSDDYFFGILQSRIHEIWARAQGTQLRERESGFRYTPTTCFETFPFPEPTSEQEQTIAEAAAKLNQLRENWLNPAEWTREEILEFPGSVDGPWAKYVHDPNPEGVGTVRYPRIVPRETTETQDFAAQLKKRTLTNLYNQRPTWLDLAHKKLDQAVFAAYGWGPEMEDEELLGKLLTLNLERAS